MTHEEKAEILSPPQSAGEKFTHWWKYSAGERKLMNMIRALDKKVEMNMAAIDNLNTAVTKLQGSATAILAVVSAGNQDAAIQTAADAVSAVADSLQAAVPAPAPAP